MRAQPVDVLKQKSFNQYLDNKWQEDLLKIYKNTYKDYIKHQNKIDAWNLKKIEKNLLELWVTQEKITEFKSRAVKEDIKFNKLDVVIRQAIKENRKVTSKERFTIARELAKQYKDKSLKRALRAVDDIIKEKIELAQ